MKPFRKNVAIAIDGGGIRGVMVARALAMLEEKLSKPLFEIARLVTGTSTGSIISVGLASGLTAAKMQQLYIDLGETIFRKSWRTFFWPFTRYRYPHEPLENALRQQIGDRKMGDYWSTEPRTDIVITAFDVPGNKTCFIKPFKDEYKDWPVVKAVLASSSVPTYFPVVEGRYVDGGVGSYANPCYLAAFEAKFILKWDPEETTLLSFGTGRDPQAVEPGEPSHFHAWNWLMPILDAFMASASDQQVRLVDTFFENLDFRRFQVDLKKSILMDDPSRIPELIQYGTQMGEMILSDAIDGAVKNKPVLPRRSR